MPAGSAAASAALWVKVGADGSVLASASDQELLLEENIEGTDVFCALTNDDEANIMASMLAKRLGARTVMTLINNPAYVDLVQGGVCRVLLRARLLGHRRSPHPERRRLTDLLRRFCQHDLSTHRHALRYQV